MRERRFEERVSFQVFVLLAMQRTSPNRSTCPRRRLWVQRRSDALLCQYTRVALQVERMRKLTGWDSCECEWLRVLRKISVCFRRATQRT